MGLGGISVFIIAVLIGITLVVGANIFYGGVLDNYSVEYENATTQTNTEAALSDLNQSVASMANNLRTSSATERDFISLSSGGFSSILQSFNVLDASVDLLSASSSYLAQSGIDINWFITNMIILLSMLLVFYLVFTILGREF